MTFEDNIRAIKAQSLANIVYDLLRGGQQERNFLLKTLNTIDADCLSAFCQQLSKRIEQEGAK